MSKWFLRLAAIIFAFTIEVRVHAIELETESCPKTAIKCAFFTRSLEVIQTEGYEVRAKPGTAFKALEADKMEIVSGSMAIFAKKPLVVKSLYGEVLLNSAKAVVTVDNNWLSLKSVDGEVLYRGNGHDFAVKLDAGLQVRFGRVDQTGKAKTEFPKLITKEPFVKAWAGYFSSSEYEEAKRDLEVLAENTYKLRDPLEFTYLKSIERAQASLDQERELERQKQEKAAEENRFYRDLFLRKNFMKF